KRIPYTALSDTLGGTKHTNFITLNEKPFPVAKNPFLFLNQHHTFKRFSVYWIDAISINQDLVERSHQVGHMTNIFQSAERVAVWLGE
ncbi:hypothetical protein K469DRAFT_577746, partial [Zopfia rhizophila CBS 207.26]